MPQDVTEHKFNMGSSSPIQRWRAAAKKLWTSWNLARQFAVCASLVLLPAMTVTGLWVTNRIEHGVINSAGASAALYLENFVEPLVQELAAADTLTPENFKKLANLLSQTSLGQQVVSFKIWRRGNIIAYASRSDIIGQAFPPTDGLRGAWRGSVSAELDHLEALENKPERETGIPLLEVYLPLRERGSERIIAVAEFYENAQKLKTELFKSNLQSWLVVGAVALSMLASLFQIVRRGSATIVMQRQSLEDRVTQLTQLLQENGELRKRVQLATIRASESNEIYLRRLGADLHDGPAQLISLALLKLEEAPPGSSPPSTHNGPPQAMPVKAVLTDALNDIRNIAAGLAVPEIEALSLGDALQSAIASHQTRTGSAVTAEFNLASVQVPQALKLCAYRVVQEGLSNAFHHAGGNGQSVRVRAAPLDRTPTSIVIEVLDSGKSQQERKPSHTQGIGLRGLTDRVESIGGSLTFQHDNERGSVLRANIPIDAGVQFHA